MNHTEDAYSPNFDQSPPSEDEPETLNFASLASKWDANVPDFNPKGGIEMRSIVDDDDSELFDALKGIEPEAKTIGEFIENKLFEQAVEDCFQTELAKLREARSKGPRYCVNTLAMAMAGVKGNRAQRRAAMSRKKGARKTALRAGKKVG